MPAMSEAILLRGDDTLLTPPVELRAGPLDMIFEPDTALLRYVRVDGEEIVRGVYVAVRDHNWGTVEPSLSDLAIDAREDAFDVRFVADCRQDDIHFVWRGVITGSSEGVVRFSMDGVAHSRFQRNRIGFCVLHPMSVAGQTCAVEHVDGSQTDGVFPERISPHQPFMDIRAITHELRAGGDAEVCMDGDTFEMEDQRNWTDASYKTYCTPLAVPFPVGVESGDTVEQSVTMRALEVARTPRARGRADMTTPVVRLGEDVVGRVPSVGLGDSSHDAAPTEEEATRLQTLGAQHLRADIRPDGDGWRDHAARAATLAAQIDAPLEIALLLPADDASDEALRSVVEWTASERPRIARWIVLHDDLSTTSARTFADARRALGAYAPDAPMGLGTDCYFTELNRDRPDIRDADFISYSINPQVHAFDDASLVETLEAQPVTVESAGVFAGEAPVVVSPVTLRPRFNPNATGEASEPTPGELPPEVDKRQMSLFGAAWTLGSIARLASAGVVSATYYEPTGPRGVMDASASRETPAEFARVEGGVYPLYHALRDVCGFAGGRVLRVEVSDPLAVAALSVASGSRRATWVANLTPRECEVVVEGLAPGRYTVRTLDASNAERAMLEPEAYGEGIACMRVGEGATTLALGAYGVARVGIDEVPVGGHFSTR